MPAPMPRRRPRAPLRRRSSTARPAAADAAARPPSPASQSAAARPAVSRASDPSTSTRPSARCLPPSRAIAVAPATAAGARARRRHRVPDAVPDADDRGHRRRVIARMSDESMRAAVLDVAERLVREEIDRIKNAR